MFGIFYLKLKLYTIYYIIIQLFLYFVIARHTMPKTKIGLQTILQLTT